MKALNYIDHNKRVKEVWDSYWAGDPIRIPCIVGVSERFCIYNNKANPENIDFYQYSNDVELMFNAQLEFAKFKRLNIIGDHDMGLPSEGEGWSISVDFQNYHEAAWLGGDIAYKGKEVPYATPFLNDENKEMLFEKGIPDPFSGFMAKAKEYYEKMNDMAKGYRYCGVPVKNIGVPFIGSDGIFTIACEIRGATNICLDMYENPNYVHELLNYLTEATIQKQKAWGKYLGLPEKGKGFWFADDSILLLSNEMYREFVLPYHKKIQRELSTMEESAMVHLCGDASRHFKTLKDEMSVYAFDTGFPINHGKILDELGDEVIIQGGPKAELIRCGTKYEIRGESKRIINEVKHKTKKFIFREGNDIAPLTPLENIQCMYKACEEFGRYK